MKIIMDKAPLAKALVFISGVAKIENPASPVYESVQLEICESAGKTRTATLSAADGVVWLSRSAPCDAPEAGAKWFLPRAQLTRIVAALNDGEVELDFLGGDVVDITSGGFKARLRCFGDLQLPAPPKVEALATPFPGEILKSLLDAVIGSVAQSIDRPALCGVSLGELDGRLFAVAADGGRIAVASASMPPGEPVDGSRTAEAPSAPMTMPGVILPPALVARMSDLCEVGPVFVVWGERAAHFSVPGARIIGLLIDAKFPDWRRALPKFEGASVQLERQRLVKALQRVNGIASKRGKSPLPVDLKLVGPDSDPVELELLTSQSGRLARERIATSGLEGTVKGSSRIHAAFLLEAAQALTTSVVRLDLPGNPAQPVGLSASGETKGGVTVQHWIMPRT